jgi:SNF2 family DNA or RNA helicase
MSRKAGLGKSAQALLAAVEPVLVVAPAMALDGGVWDDEVAKWTPGMDVTQVAYSALSERVSTSRFGSKPTGKLKPEYDRKWGTVVLDEAHYVKGRKTSWTKAVQKLRTDRMDLMTGTPLPNWAYEAFTLLQLIYPEEAKAGRRLGSYWRWVAEWFELGELRGRGGQVISQYNIGDLLPTRDWDEFREANWGDRMLRRLREDCLDLPPLVQQPIRVRMKPKQAKAYAQLERDFVTWLDNGTEIAAWSQASQLMKLAKCATGLELLDPEERCSAKLDALQDLLTDRPRPTLVVGFFRDTVDQARLRAVEIGKTALMVRGGDSKKERATAVRAFQSGHLDVLCATIDTISEALTFNIADQIIFVERSWRPTRNEQAMRRIHRIGQDKPVLSIDLITRDSADERVLDLLANKTDQQMKALGDKELRQLIGDKR